jgi:GGDEF domain-containing protein
MKMTPAGVPGGFDRRATKAYDQYTSAAREQYTRVVSAAPASYQPAADSYRECPTREYLVNVIERQVAISKQQNVPLSLVLVELLLVADANEAKRASYADGALTAVTKIFRSHLRPTDVILRYQQKTLGLLLPESDQKGSERVCSRLSNAISRRLIFDANVIASVPVFGISDNISRFGNPGESLLSLAELQLDLAKLKLSHD